MQTETETETETETGTGTEIEIEIEIEMELLNQIIKLKKKEKFTSDDIESMKDFIKYCISLQSNKNDDVVLTKHTLQLLFIFLQKTTTTTTTT